MRTLRAQLIFSHLLLVFLLIAVLGAAAYEFNAIRSASDTLSKQRERSQTAVFNMRDALIDMDSALAWFAVGGGEAARTRFERDVRSYRLAHAQAEGSFTGKAEVEGLKESDALVQSFIRASNRLLYAQPAPGLAAAQDYFLRILNVANGRCLRGLQLLRDTNQHDLARVSSIAREDYRRSLGLIIGGGSVAVLLALLLSLRLTRRALGALETLASQAERIGQGDTGERIPITRNDEFRQLADSFNAMAEEVSRARKQDISRAETAEKLSAIALHNLVDPVIVTGADLRLARMNASAEAVFGPAGERIGQPVRDVLNNDRVFALIQRAVSEPEAGAEGVRAFVPLAVAGEKRFFRVRSMPIVQPDSQMVGTVTLLEDVTRLQELERAKSEFINVASHELKTPVASLLLSLELLEAGRLGQESDTREILETQRQDLTRLQEMLSDLLDVSRLEAGAMQPRLKTIDPASPVRDAVDMVRRMAEQLSVSIVVDIDYRISHVLADERQIARVLVNLLDNALRHAEEQSAIRVRVRQASDQVVFSVADQGPGIPSAYVGRVFDRFVQIPGSAVGSSGLGLYIARSIVEAHGGQINAGNLPEGGAVFEFRIPAAEPSEQTPSS